MATWKVTLWTVAEKPGQGTTVDSHLISTEEDELRGDNELLTFYREDLCGMQGTDPDKVLIRVEEVYTEDLAEHYANARSKDELSAEMNRYVEATGFLPHTRVGANAEDDGWWDWHEKPFRTVDRPGSN